MFFPNRIDEAILLAIPVVLLLFPIQYLALRVRDARAVPQDPHLGRKALLYFFFNAAVFLVLVGLSVSSLDWFEHLFDPVVQAQRQRQGGGPAVVPPGLSLTPGRRTRESRTRASCRPRRGNGLTSSSGRPPGW